VKSYTSSSISLGKWVDPDTVEMASMGSEIPRYFNFKRGDNDCAATDAWNIYYQGDLCNFEDKTNKFLHNTIFSRNLGNWQFHLYSPFFVCNIKFPKDKGRPYFTSSTEKIVDSNYKSGNFYIKPVSSGAKAPFVVAFAGYFNWNTNIEVYIENDLNSNFDIYVFERQEIWRCNSKQTLKRLWNAKEGVDFSLTMAMVAV
jgi:hypothetical protein